MIIMKIKKGFYLCKSPVDGTHYAIVLSHTQPFKAAFTTCTKCCFFDECRNGVHPKKPLIKYLGIERSCFSLFREANFPKEDGNMIYFKRFKGGV